MQRQPKRGIQGEFIDAIDRRNRPFITFQLHSFLFSRSLFEYHKLSRNNIIQDKLNKYSISSHLTQEILPKLFSRGHSYGKECGQCGPESVLTVFLGLAYLTLCQYLHCKSGRKLVDKVIDSRQTKQMS